jgi:hypothetical protein
MKASAILRSVHIVALAAFCEVCALSGPAIIDNDPDIAAHLETYTKGHMSTLLYSIHYAIEIDDDVRPLSPANSLVRTSIENMMLSNEKISSLKSLGENYNTSRTLRKPTDEEWQRMTEEIQSHAKPVLDQMNKTRQSLLDNQALLEKYVREGQAVGQWLDDTKAHFTNLLRKETDDQAKMDYEDVIAEIDKYITHNKRSMDLLRRYSAKCDSLLQHLLLRIDKFYSSYAALTVSNVHSILQSVASVCQRYEGFNEATLSSFRVLDDEIRAIHMEIIDWLETYYNKRPAPRSRELAHVEMTMLAAEVGNLLARWNEAVAVFNVWKVRIARAKAADQEIVLRGSAVICGVRFRRGTRFQIVDIEDMEFGSDHGESMMTLQPQLSDDNRYMEQVRVPATSLSDLFRIESGGHANE